VAYSQTLARRVRLALAARSDVAEKPMFGGLTFMVQGNMTCGVAKSKEELMIRLAAETTLASFESPYVRMCDFTKRPMRGLFLVSAEGCANQRKCRSLGWIGAPTCSLTVAKVTLVLAAAASSVANAARKRLRRLLTVCMYPESYGKTFAIRTRTVSSPCHFNR